MLFLGSVRQNVESANLVGFTFFSFNSFLSKNNTNSNVYLNEVEDINIHTHYYHTSLIFSPLNSFLVIPSIILSWNSPCIKTSSFNNPSFLNPAFKSIFKAL